MMITNLRFVAVLTIFLMIACAFIFYTTTLGLCFDACPADLANVIPVQYFSPIAWPGFLLDSGFGCSFAVWLLFIKQGIPRHGWGWWLLVALYPLVLIVAASMVVITLGGHFIPINIDEFNPWSVFILFMWVGLLLWSVFVTITAFAWHSSSHMKLT